MRKYIPIALRSQEQIEHERATHRARQQKFRNGNDDYAGREQRRNYQRHATQWPLHPDRFEPISADGEAADDGTYDIFQVYSRTLGTRMLYQGMGIDLPHYLDFVKQMKKIVRGVGCKRGDLVYFAHGYDHEKILLQTAELTDNQKVALAKQRSRSYRAVVEKGKNKLEIDIPQLQVEAYIGKKSGRFLQYDEEHKVYSRINYTDLFSFFNSGFVEAVEKFSRLWTPEENEKLAPLLVLVKQGKEARQNWTAFNFDNAKRVRYNEAELILTDWLVRMVVRLCMDVALYPASLAGPAPLARALIQKYGVTKHIKPKDYDTIEYQHSEWNMVCRKAFTAGHIETLVQGIVDSWVEYDITSAYPHMIANLPCGAHGHAHHLTKEETDACNQLGATLPEFAIYHVAWRCPRNTRFGPFPVRGASGGIYYPTSGDTWVCTPELVAFIECGHGTYQIYDVWQWISECKEKHPFGEMIVETYNERQRLLDEGHPGEYILKLASNSLYGLLSQCAGAQRIVDEKGETIGYKTPRYSNLFLAGYVTSGCRARIYRAAMCNPANIIGFSTDAIQVHEADPTIDALCPERKTLGLFEKKEVGKTLFVAPGVRFVENGKNSKLRGYPWSPDISAKFFDAWRAGERSVALSSRRFQNILHCATRDEQGVYTINQNAGRFIEEERTCDISENVLHSKRDITWYNDEGGPYKYVPPYQSMILGGPCIYKRPMDPGLDYFSDETHRLGPDD